MTKLNQSGMAEMAVGAIVMLVVGFTGGYAIGHHAKNNKTTSESGSSNSQTTADTDGVTVGGAKMVASKDIVANALNAKNVTTVVAAVKAAGLVPTLQSAGPFTVFAPNNAAFAALPAGTVDTLLKPENKDQLVNILTYHVVPGTYTSAALKVMAEKGQTLTTVQGEKLSPVMHDNQLELKDAKGNFATIQTSDVISSNGVTFVINNVLMP
ncbi:MAG TPA: fasciclin domain-containing protein [Candidatus Saccharimonadales bacterium]|nr:fasciclin domain-containing protein [Candidatus Saccharimonadales bacterium]